MILVVIALWIAGMGTATAAFFLYRQSHVDRSWYRLTVFLCVPAGALFTAIAVANQGIAVGLGAGLLFSSAITLGSVYRWRQKRYFLSIFRRKMESNPALREQFEKRAIFRRAFRSLKDDSTNGEGSRTS